MREITTRQRLNLSHSNQRKYWRVQPEKDFPLRIDLNGTNFLDVLYATDVSMGGIGIIVPHGFVKCKIQAPISLIITLPEPKPASITINGTITHLSNSRFGVNFGSLGDRQSKNLSRYIAYLLRDEPWVTRFKFKLGIL